MADATVVAISDVGTKLMYLDSTTSKYKQLVSVISTPDTWKAPASIDVTTLDSPINQSIPGRPDLGNFEFEYNYTKANFTAVLAICDGTTPHKYLIVFNDGAGVQFDGIGSTGLKGVSKGKQVTAGISVAVTAIANVTDTSTLIG